MIDRDAENKSQINQICKSLLVKAGEKPDPDLLYALQLMQWAILEGNHGLPEAYKIDVRSMVENMMGMDHSLVMRFITQETDDAVRLTAEELLDATPAEAAQILIQALHSAMSARMAGYPPPL